MVNKKIPYVALVIIIAAIVISLVVFFSMNSVPPSTTSNSSFTTSGHVVYVYPTSNQSAGISASVGEIFGIQLSGNGGSTGYNWNFTISKGIIFLHSTLVSSSNVEPGAPVTYDYYFQVTQSGNQSILFQDKRQFAPYDVFATINLHITVP